MRYARKEEAAAREGDRRSNDMKPGDYFFGIMLPVAR
jgi:hypothetical protein